MRTILLALAIASLQTMVNAQSMEVAKNSAEKANAATEKLPLYKHPTILRMWKKNNELRQASGLAPQKLSPKLTRLAQEWANYMAKTGHYEHNYGHGYPEIIHSGPTTISGAFAGWMGSPGHHAIMMGGNGSAGFGYQVSADGHPYWVGVYGDLAAPPVKAEVKTPAVAQVANVEKIEKDEAEKPELDATTAIAKSSVAKAVDLKKVPLHKHPTITRMLKKNNEIRIAAGQPAQQLSPELTKLAQDWANYMAKTGNYVHNYGHSYPEIIHSGPTTISGAFAGWVGSGAHYGIMLSGNNAAGFGYQVASNGHPYWVGVYGNVAVPKEDAAKTVKQASATEEASEEKIEAPAQAPAPQAEATDHNNYYYDYNNYNYGRQSRRNR